MKPRVLAFFSVLVILVIVAIRIHFLYAVASTDAMRYEVQLRSGDSGHYLQIGKNLAEFGAYSDDGSGKPTEMATWRPPVWPIMLSGFFSITSSLLFILICKTLIEIGLVVFALKRIQNHFNLNWLYVLPFLLLLLEPHYIKYSTTFLTESLTAVLMLVLAVLFITVNPNRSSNIAIPLLGALIILCHPVSIFFVLAVVGFYLLLLVRQNWQRAAFHSFLFVFIVALWPIRNELVFGKGIYLTASQGATFSKGWNEDVLSTFTNAQGDLADESLNLKYLPEAERTADIGIILGSKRLQKATFAYIHTLSFSEILQIAGKKLESNFNPFPEVSKETNLERACTFLRCLFLVNFVVLLYQLLIRRKLRFSVPRERILMVVFAILIGQTSMSIYIYTGLRFNSIYGVTSLFCFISLVIALFNPRILSKIS